MLGNICEDHQVSHEVTNTFLFFFVANNLRLKTANNIGIVAVCLSCPDAPTDKQNAVLGSTRDIHPRSSAYLDFQG